MSCTKSKIKATEIQFKKLLLLFNSRKMSGFILNQFFLGYGQNMRPGIKKKNRREVM